MRIKAEEKQDAERIARLEKKIEELEKNCESAE